MINRDNLGSYLNDASLWVNHLNALGHDEVGIIGGARRVQALGGSTTDIDIAVIIEPCKLYELRRDLESTSFQLQHFSPYEDSEGFFADWRSGSINIIAYDAETYSSIQDLIGRFDLNINQFYVDTNGNIQNDYFDGSTVKVNPKRDHQHQTGRLDSRIRRFQDLYPELDWSSLNV